MGRVVGWVVCFLAIGLLEIPRLWRKREIYDLWVYSILLFATALYGLLFLLEVPLPDPEGLIKLIFGPIGERIMGQR